MGWGYKHTPEAKAKISAVHKGKTISEEHKRQISVANKLAGRKPPSPKGLIRSAETRKKMGDAKRGAKNPNYGKPLTEEAKLNLSRIMREQRRGSGNPAWKGGITPLRVRIRTAIEYLEWRSNVFTRDDYTCQDCGIRSGVGVHVELEAHHKIGLEILLKQFTEKNSSLSLQKDVSELIYRAISYAPFWDIDNGETLCVACHAKTKNGKPKKEKAA